MNSDTPSLTLNFSQAMSTCHERLDEALSNEPRLPLAVAFARNVLGADDTSDLALAKKAIEFAAGKRRPDRGPIWDHLWEKPAWWTPYAFRRNTLGFRHSHTVAGWMLDWGLDYFTLLELGSGTGLSAAPVALAGLPTIAVEPTAEFRHVGERVMPEARWHETASTIQPPTGRILLQFSHVLNVRDLADSELIDFVRLTTDAEEVLVGEATNSNRSCRTYRRRHLIRAELERLGFEKDWDRHRDEVLDAGYGQHELLLEAWVR